MSTAMTPQSIQQCLTELMVSDKRPMVETVGRYLQWCGIVSIQRQLLAKGYPNDMRHDY
jgi:hypothetical protein